MAKDDFKNSSGKADFKKASALDRAASQLLKNVDSSYVERKLLSSQDVQFQKVIDRQLDIAKGVAGHQVVDFFGTVRSERKSGKSNKQLGVDTADLFTENVGDIFSYFQDIYKNRYLEVSDLKFISKFIPSLGEAVRIYLDSMISSDDVSQTITRKIEMPGITDPATQQQITDRIAAMEEEYRLLPKLKVAYKKTLVSGRFFVYHISYKDLFEMYSAGVASGKILRQGSSLYGNTRDQVNKDKESSIKSVQGKMPSKPNVLGIAEEASFDGMEYAAEQAIPIHSVVGTALESFGMEAEALAQQGAIRKLSYDTRSMRSAMESLEELASSSKAPFVFTSSGRRIESNEFGKKLKESLESDLPNIYFVDSPIPLDVAQETASVAMEDFNEFFNLRKDVDENLDKVRSDMGKMVDGTYDAGSKSSRGQTFDGVTGTYLKWIDYKYVIPIDILGTRVGYYHIVTTPKTKNKTMNGRSGNKATEIGGILSSGSMSLFDQMDISEKRKETAIQNIVDSISNGILDQFGTKFVKKNAPFKKLIAECIIANGLVDNDYMIQFIPVENMIEFKCNEDENSEGESILSDAMFPAHLLLSIVICKMLNYINKGGNRTIAHVSSGRVNRSLSNQVNRVIRDIQAGNVTFTDLLSSSMVFSKVTRDSNIAMPKDQQGNRLVEFEVQEGQEIDLSTNYESMLERWCMMATGMPPTIMDYTSDVNIARKVVSDNVQVAGRVASLQADMEGPTTELYRALIQDSDMSDTDKTALLNMKFKLPRPRILANQNTNEALGIAMQNAQTIANVIVGEDASEEDDMLRKRFIISRITRNETPYLDWTELDRITDEANIDLIRYKVEKNANAALANGTAENQENPENGLSDLGGFDDVGAEDTGMGDEDMNF